jgi:hypothetical protein
MDKDSLFLLLFLNAGLRNGMLQSPLVGLTDRLCGSSFSGVISAPPRIFPGEIPIPRNCLLFRPASIIDPTGQLFKHLDSAE